mmetsp:Transcript_10924/g.38036  ORF Transcript_10924/g.38036 Transcript_10924/m.38036 type:complete len:356 (-) Transcript_10924:1029-2096(-)
MIPRDPIAPTSLELGTTWRCSSSHDVDEGCAAGAAAAAAAAVAVPPRRRRRRRLRAAVTVADSAALVALALALAVQAARQAPERGGHHQQAAGAGPVEPRQLRRRAVAGDAAQRQHHDGLVAQRHRQPQQRRDRRLEVPRDLRERKLDARDGHQDLGGGVEQELRHEQRQARPRRAVGLGGRHHGLDAAREREDAAHANEADGHPPDLAAEEARVARVEHAHEQRRQEQHEERIQRGDVGGRHRDRGAADGDDVVHRRRRHLPQPEHLEVQRPIHGQRAEDDGDARQRHAVRRVRGAEAAAQRRGLCLAERGSAARTAAAAQAQARRHQHARCRARAAAPQRPAAAVRAAHVLAS